MESKPLKRSHALVYSLLQQPSSSEKPFKRPKIQLIEEEEPRGEVQLQSVSTEQKEQEEDKGTDAITRAREFLERIKLMGDADLDADAENREVGDEVIVLEEINSDEEEEEQGGTDSESSSSSSSSDQSSSSSSSVSSSSSAQTSSSDADTDSSDTGSP
jgi:hypothetical protein